MRSALVIVFMCLQVFAFGQHVVEIIVKDEKTQEVLPGATALVVGTSIGASADEQGRLILKTVPEGKQTIKISFVGYEDQIIELTFSLATAEAIIVLLEPVHEELEEVMVTSTRSSRTIADIPTRVEFIAGEELEEKGNMKPGDIRLLLSESTGIQTQQTSATSANASIRIQGLDGRYTQILKDGFPLYAGFSGGLGLLQTPPLDLKQVEVIKGSSSTLYGGGAIAGLVNLISKRPTDERELRFWINGTSALGIDVNGFYGEKFGKAGLTLFVARNSNEAYDPADIDLSAIPQFDRYTINPKLFLDLNERNNFEVGFSLITEDRIGGDMHYIDGKGDATHSYYEKNNSDRFSTQLSFTHSFSDDKKLQVKNSYSFFNRIIGTPGYKFDGVQNSTFTEINYSSNHEKSDWIGGVNIWTDQFKETQLTATPLRDYDQVTVGGFIQNNWMVSQKFRLETGLRGDYVVDYGFALLPRVSLMYKLNHNFSSRVGFGLGYKTPTIFTEESERIQYAAVLPISTSSNSLEKSHGASWDLNYKTSIANGAIGVNFNHLFFYTNIDNPLLLIAQNDATLKFENIKGNTDTKGMETNVRLDYGDFKLFLGYTYTHTENHNNGVERQNPLTPKHRLNNVLMYEVEEKWKVGLEAYYFSEQKLSDGATG